MNDAVPLAAGDTALFTPLIFFLVLVGVCLLFSLMTGLDGDSTADFYVADRSFPALRNSLALVGDYIPATALLGPIGTVALSGYDGMAAAAAAGAAMAVLLVMAQPLRNTGRFALGSILAARMDGRATRVAGMVTTLVVVVPLTVVQLSAAGSATAYVVGLKSAGAAQICMVMIGVLVVAFAAFGGMRGTSAIQIAKTVLVAVAIVVVAAAAARALGWDLGALMEQAAVRGGGGGTLHRPGLLFGRTPSGSLELFSLFFTVSLGSAVMPPLLMRIGASADGRSARRASGYAAFMITGFYVATVLLGLAAAALVGAGTITSDDPQGNSALFLLAETLTHGTGGSAAFTLVACAVFLTAISALAGLLLSGAAALSHDLYAAVLRGGRASDREELAVARWAILAIGLLGILLSVLLHGWSILFLASFAGAVAAAVILPALVYSLFWPGFSRRGLLWTIYGSPACCFVLQFFGPTVSGRPYSLLREVDFHWFPLQNIALVAVPLGFLLGWAGSRLAPPSREQRAIDAAVETAMLAGAD